MAEEKSNKNSSPLNISASIFETNKEISNGNDSPLNISAPFFEMNKGKSNKNALPLNISAPIFEMKKEKSNENDSPLNISAPIFEIKEAKSNKNASSLNISAPIFEMNENGSSIKYSAPSFIDFNLNYQEDPINVAEENNSSFIQQAAYNDMQPIQVENNSNDIENRQNNSSFIEPLDAFSPKPSTSRMIFPPPQGLHSLEAQEFDFETFLTNPVYEISPGIFSNEMLPPENSLDTEFQELNIDENYETGQMNYPPLRDPSLKTYELRNQRIEKNIIKSQNVARMADEALNQFLQRKWYQFQLKQREIDSILENGSRWDPNTTTGFCSCPSKQCILEKSHTVDDALRVPAEERIFEEIPEDKNCDNYVIRTLGYVTGRDRNNVQKPIAIQVPIRIPETSKNKNKKTSKNYFSTK